MYYAQGNISKEGLVERYAPMVKRIALHLTGRLPPNIQLDDLIQVGLLGLLEAAGNYDERQGASFETYASIRIRGAMLDEVRRQDWVPKSVHRKAREIAEAVRVVEAEKGAGAVDHEVAKQLGISLSEYHELLSEASAGKWMSLEDLGSEESPFVDQCRSDELPPLERLLDEHFNRHLAEAITSLPERERLIIALYYDQGLNLKEIGAVIGVGESRVSQLMSQAHARLRARLHDWVTE